MEAGIHDGIVIKQGEAVPQSFLLSFSTPSFCDPYSQDDVQSDVLFEDSLTPISWNSVDENSRTYPGDVQLSIQEDQRLVITLSCTKKSNKDCNPLKVEEGFSIPLVTFQQQAVVVAPTKILASCPLFARYFLPKQFIKQMEIQFNSGRMMEAFLLVLNCLGSSPSINSLPDPLENAKRVLPRLLAQLEDGGPSMIEQAPIDNELYLNLFEVAAASCLLGHNELQTQCELLLLRDIDLDLFVRAAQYASVCRRELMLKALYFSMKRLGLRSMDNLDRVWGKNSGERSQLEQPRIEVQSPTDQFKQKFKQLKSELRVHRKRTKHELKHQLGVSPRITVDQSTGEMVSKQGLRCPLNIFKDQIAQEHKLKKGFFDGKLYPAPDPDAYKEGYKGLTQYYVQRTRSEDGMTQTFRVFRQGSTRDMELAAITTADVTSFEFAMTDSDFTPYGDKYLGKMTSSFTGRFFHLYDYGLSSNRMYPQDLLPEMIRKEYCLVVYSVNILGREPNQFEVLVPDVSLEEVAQEEEAFNESLAFQEHLHSDTMPSQSKDAAVEERYRPSKLAKVYSKNQMAGAGYKLLKTQQAQWDHRIQAWTLDFKGRVKVPSKKNFIVVDPADPKLPYMVFGKVTKNRFSLDCRAPLTPLMALYIALTSFATKLLVT